jgi:hypothetical protein
MTSPGTRPDAHCASAEMLSVLYSLYPGFRLIDGVFPQLPLSWRHGGGVALNLGGAGDAEDNFYARFRQQGGHAPVLGADTLMSHLRALDFAAPPPATTAFVASANNVHALLDAVKPAALANDVIVLQDARNVPAELAAAGFPAGLKLTFRRPSRSQSYVLSTRSGLDAAAFDAVMQSLRQIAVDMREGANAHGWRDLRVDLPEEGFRPAKAQVAPALFIHDGARLSEGDAAYSWIWTGEERRIRILLGCIPPHYRKLRLVVPNATPPSNLRQARVFLNGERTPSRVETWGESAGTLEVELTPRSAELVVTLAAPEAAGGLSICIDRIEVSA